MQRRRNPQFTAPNEAITVPAALAIESGDALLTLHRDSGAILSYYLDPEQLFPSWLASPGERIPEDFVLKRIHGEARVVRDGKDVSVISYPERIAQMVRELAPW